MKSKFIKGLLFTFMMVASAMFTSCGYERVDAGYEGIKVNLYGDDKGVDDITLVTGAVWYNPITTAVYEYPTFVQQMMLDKWDGKLPLYGTMPTLFKNIAGK